MAEREAGNGGKEIKSTQSCAVSSFFFYFLAPEIFLPFLPDRSHFLLSIFYQLIPVGHYEFRCPKTIVPWDR